MQIKNFMIGLFNVVIQFSSSHIYI